MRESHAEIALSECAERVFARPLETRAFEAAAEEEATRKPRTFIQACIYMRVCVCIETGFTVSAQRSLCFCRGLNERRLAATVSD